MRKLQGRRTAILFYYIIFIINIKIIFIPMISINIINIDILILVIIIVIINIIIVICMLTYCYIEDLLARPSPTAPIDKIDWHDRDRASERARGPLLMLS